MRRTGTVGECNQHRHHHDISGEEDADQPARFRFRKRPALYIAGQQCRQRKSAELCQHLSGDNGADTTAASGSGLAHVA
jgi:hypothetical protein